MKIFKLVFIVLFAFSFGIDAQHTVSIDSTFGVNGKTITKITPEGRIRGGLKTIRQTDGKIIGASTFAGYPILARYTNDGSLDSSWGTNGIVRYLDTIDNNFLFKLTQLDNGQILIAGQKSGATVTSGGNLIYLMKLNSDGSLDSNFGVNGAVNYIYQNGAYFALNSFFVNNSKIYVTGRTSGQVNGVIAFDLSTGDLNSNFGNNGFMQVNFNGYYGGMFICKVTSNGKIRAFMGDRIYQLLPDFQVDVNGSFGTNGYLELPCKLGNSSYGGFSHGPEGQSSIFYLREETLANNDFLVAGISFSCPSRADKGMVIKYLPDGAIDSSFATNGIFEVDFRRDSTETNYINSVKVLGNGYILVSGGVYENSYYASTGKVTKRFAMALYDDNGNPINSFGNIGEVYRENYFHTSDSLDWLANSFIQEDDKIVLVGFTPHYDPYDFPTIGTGFEAVDFLSINISRYKIQGISAVGTQSFTKEDLTLYPNPTNSILNFKSSESINQVLIYNYLGKLVIQKSGHSINQLDVEQLGKGIYVVRLKSESGSVYNGKFVKE